MVDIHCHMLPGIDDGAKNWEMAEEMARIALADGITHVVCTPHANDKYPYDREAHEGSLQELGRRTGGKLHFSLGCDFHFSFENLEEALVNPEKFLISGTDYLLVEFSDYAMSPQTGNMLLRLSSMGITPIITHPERNLILQRKPEHVLDFVQNGCLVQVTANSVTGHWGEKPKSISHWLLSRNAVHVLATDAHDPKHRPPILSKAREAVAKDHGDELAYALTAANPQAIILNEPVPFHPEITSKR